MASVQRRVFGSLPDGRRIDAFELRNASGLSATFLTLGATLQSVMCPSKAGSAEELTLNYPDLPSIASDSNFFGNTIGRVANRIRAGSFHIGDKAYTLPLTDGINCEHGGVRGYHRVVWGGEAYASEGVAGVRFTYASHDGEEGYPGNVNVTADYSLSADNVLKMVFSAVTDAPTPINLCNHAYWNLTGGFKSDVKGHILQLNAPYFLPVDKTQIPVGVSPVVGTPMDFTTPTPVGSRILSIDGGGEPGYDHCYGRVAAGGPYDPTTLAPIADLFDPVSERRMIVSTTQPGVQLYTGNFLKGAAPHDQHYALCLETQHYPDAINQSDFPSVLLSPGETYSQTTTHAFSW